MIILIYTILVILQQFKGMTTEVADPCPTTIVNSIVVDMCKSGSATEETSYGSHRVDSVVLRIMTQQDNCICQVTLDNQIQPVSVGLRTYDGLTASSPEKAECGLAIDIDHIPDMSTGNATSPIECIHNVDLRSIPLLQNSMLQFKSRIINGNFTRGYCMRIRRDSSSDHSQVLRIDCDAPMTTEQTTEKIKTYDQPQSSQQTSESAKSTTNSSNIDSTTTVTTTNVKHQSKATTTDMTTGIEQTTYIVIGAGSGVALILLVVLVVICLRNKVMHNSRRTNDNTNNKHYCDLKNNVPSVPGQEYDMIESNYNTIDVDRSQPSNKVVVMEGEYVTVEVDGHLTNKIN